MTRRRSAGQVTAEQFIELATREFDFLVEALGFAPWQAIADDDAAAEVIFHRPPTAVTIGFEWRDRYLYVEFFESSGEPVPPDVLRRRHRFSLDDLLTIRAPELKINHPEFDQALAVGAAREQLAAYAKALRQYALDVLRGDWTIFPQIEAVMQDRERRWREEESGRA